LTEQTPSTSLPASVSQPHCLPQALLALGESLICIVEFKLQDLELSSERY